MLEFVRESEKFISVKKRNGINSATLYKVDLRSRWEIYSIVVAHTESFHLRQIADKLEELNGK